MAVLQGIQGMNIGDGKSGKIALSLQTRVLRILADNVLSYATATAMNPAQVKAGTCSYYVPEIIGSSDYGTGTGAFDVPQSGLVTFNLDTRRSVKYEYETFDVERLNESDYIIGMISNGIAMSIQADLNGQFWKFLADKFDKNNGDVSLKTQTIALKYLTKENVDETPDNMRKDLLKLEFKMNKINQMFDKAKLGVPKAEIMSIVAPIVDTNMKYGFWNQPNLLGQWVISKTLAGNQIGNIKYTVDPMLNNNIAANTSFNKDQTLDFSKVFGFMFHNEAIAMPINVEQIWQGVNPENANPRFIAKYQFGIGILRPKLIYKIIDEADALSARETKQAEKDFLKQTI